MTPDLPPDVPIEQSVDIGQSLAEYALHQCSATRVDVEWTGFASRLLPESVDRLVWQGDPCRARPRLRVAAVVDDVAAERFTVEPSLRIWIGAPVASADFAPGDVVSTVDGLVVVGELRGVPARSGIASVAILEGRPVTSSVVHSPPDAANGTSVELVYRRGNLRIVADGRLLEDARLGDSVRVVNAASRAVARGVLTTESTVEIVR